MLLNKQRLPIDQRGPAKKKTPPPATELTFSPKINIKKNNKIP
jgi:hypothetical protein